MKVMGELCISHLKSLGARTTSLNKTSRSQSVSIWSKLRSHSDAMSVSSGCHSLPSGVLGYSIIQLSVQIGQRHVLSVVTGQLGASGPVLMDADGVSVLLVWIKSSHLASNRNLNSSLMWIRCLWRLSLNASPCSKPIFERLKLRTIQ